MACLTLRLRWNRPLVRRVEEGVVVEKLAVGERVDEDFEGVMVWLGVGGSGVGSLEGCADAA
jgi:hypothetical protein